MLRHELSVLLFAFLLILLLPAQDQQSTDPVSRAAQENPRPHFLLQHKD